MDDFRKPYLERTRPFRHPATTYRRSDAVPRPRREGEPLRSSEDVIIQTVKLGYKIADEQILRGQEFARRLRGASARADAGDVGDLVDQSLKLMRQFAVLLVEVSESTLHAPEVLRSMARDLRDDGGRAAPQKRSGEDATTRATQPAQAVSIPVEVRSSRPARVAVTLYERPDNDVCVFPLYSPDGKVALPVTLEPIAGGGDSPAARGETPSGYFLKVVVKDEQPRGEYRGYAIHLPTRRQVGVITVGVD